ncbi:hypothetical protein PENNAL_c0349G04217, partial [Penicillium nalgiovense]
SEPYSSHLRGCRHYWCCCSRCPWPRNSPNSIEFGIHSRRHPGGFCSRC